MQLPHILKHLVLLTVAGCAHYGLCYLQYIAYLSKVFIKSQILLEIILALKDKF